MGATMSVAKRQQQAMPAGKQFFIIIMFAMPYLCNALGAQAPCHLPQTCTCGCWSQNMKWADVV